MSLLRWHGKLERYRRPVISSQLLCAGLLIYGFFIALPLTKFLGPVFGGITSVLLLVASGYLLRGNLWKEGFEAFRFFGLSVVWLILLVSVLTLGGCDRFEGAFVAQFFGLILMALIPLWLPVGLGMLIGEFRDR